MNQSQKPFTRLNHEQWQQIINQQLESDMNQKNFCQSQNISLATFANWKRKLKEESEFHSQTIKPQLDQQSISQSNTQSNNEWVELPVDLPPTIEHSPWHMELELPGGVILRMRQ